MGQLKINGAPVEFNEGETVLEAARRAGVDIPTLCYDARLKPAGSCRLCMVQLEGRPQLLPACTLPAS